MAVPGQDVGGDEEFADGEKKNGETANHANGRE